MTHNISLDLAFGFVSQYKQILQNEQFVLLTLINLLGPNYHDKICISAPAISNLTGYDIRTVQRQIAKLKIRKILTIENTYIGDGHYSGPNKYKVVGWPEWVEDHA